MLLITGKLWNQSGWQPQVGAGKTVNSALTQRMQHGNLIDLRVINDSKPRISFQSVAVYDCLVAPASPCYPSHKSWFTIVSYYGQNISWTKQCWFIGGKVEGEIVNVKIIVWSVWIGELWLIDWYLGKVVGKKRRGGICCDVPGSPCLSKTGPVVSPYFSISSGLYY